MNYADYPSTRPQNANNPRAAVKLLSLKDDCLLVGEVVYLRRSFKLDRATGKRVPRGNAASEHRVQVDESLRILDAMTFEWTSRNSRENRRDFVPRPRNQVRAFTRMLFCGECGSVCYARKSKNAKGEYYYYGCGCRQSQGPAACVNRSYIREDLLKQRVVRALGRCSKMRKA